eukprot:4156467-Pyramimonas_sp.AAC.1
MLENLQWRHRGPRKARDDNKNNRKHSKTTCVFAAVYRKQFGQLVTAIISEVLLSSLTWSTAPPLHIPRKFNPIVRPPQKESLCT